ncbi:MAG: dephospho-CoA kinase [Pseudobdellovibrio sp.]
MKWTGLTGGIATGKSTAKKLIESLGIPVIDADQISHKLSEVGASGYTQILSQFGNSILNSDLSIDRKKLGQIIFSDASLKLKLESILHPLIQTEVKAQREFHRQNGAEICFYDVPLLFEKKLWNDFDKTVLIWCDPKIQLQRLMSRNSLTEEEAGLRVANQLPLTDKVSLANYCVDNSGDLVELEKQIRLLLKRL